MVAQPDWLLVFNETSGTNVTNYGATTGSYTLQDDPTAPAMAPTTDYVWHSNTGPFKGYLESKTKNSFAMPWLATTATAPSATLETINVAIAFLIRSVDNNSCRLVSASNNPSDGGVFIQTNSPAGSGDFDLEVKFSHDGSQSILKTFSALSFNAVHQVAACIDVSGGLSAITGRYKLNAGTVQTNSTTWTSNSFEAAWPRLLRRSDFTKYYGLDGNIYYFACDRGGTAWSSGDLDAINASPAGALTGWPSSGNAPITRPSRAGSGGMGPLMTGGMTG